MPAVYARSTSTADEPTLTEPAQRLTDEAGADRRGIIAMILATLLFIVVISLYQYLSLKLDKVETEPQPRHRARWRSMQQATPPLLTRLITHFKEWWSELKVKVRRWRSPAMDERSSIDSTVGLIRTWSSKRFLGFRTPCTSKGKSFRKEKSRPPSLRPLFLEKKADTVPYQTRDSFDEDDHHAFLRSPLAFAYDIDYSAVNTRNHGRESQKVRFLDEPETPKPQGTYAPPVFNDRENRLHRRTLSHATMSRSPIDSSSEPGEPVTAALNVIPPSRARVRDLWLLSPQSSSPDHPSSIAYYSDYQDLSRSPKAHRRQDYRFPCPRTITEEQEDPFIIGDVSDRDSGSFVGL